ncbi:helix-turn-helix domain-containing protein [Sphingobacterium phlebotomi]|uniref:Helix-turn-helix domain-containing protein n=1 Tax=Sphingobacterium phlebotomi TaxID=2605433 RepID=A0A5D4HA50_9SPHI|nr:helix-turn-helix transcriptional regulator [Sphingobacterium phlebotomi]TYR36355.1 helix-turn-helix domain-containing protein [Sphingobacterium phlebotomi]
MKIRIGKRYSQEHIASVLDIKQPSYHKMEGGLTRISGEQLGVLAEFYKVNICFFYREVVDSNSDEGNLPRDMLKINEDLTNQKLLVSLLVKQNEELEQKIRDKDLMIDRLLSESMDNNENK